MSESELVEVYEAFGIGANARDIKTLMVNIRNVRRFAEYLAAIEREFFMVPGEPSDEPEDIGCEPEDECLLNKWGSTKDEYVEQFRSALSTLQDNKGKVVIDRMLLAQAAIYVYSALISYERELKKGVVGGTEGRNYSERDLAKKTYEELQQALQEKE